MNVRIVLASKYGGTREVAEAIAELQQLSPEPGREP